MFNQISILDNKGILLFDNLKEGSFFYQNECFKVFITETGHFHTMPLKSEILEIGPCFTEKIPLDDGYLYNAYDMNCDLIASALNENDLESILTNLQRDQREQYFNPLYDKKYELYQKFLSLLLGRKFNIPNAIVENGLPEIAHHLFNDGKHCIIDLNSTEVFEGKFKACIQLENNEMRFWSDNLEDLEQSIATYKRERKIKD